MSELNLEVGKFYYHTDLPENKIIFLGMEDNAYAFYDCVEKDVFHTATVCRVKPWPLEPEQKFKAGDAWERRDKKKVIIKDVGENGFLVVEESSSKVIGLRSPDGRIPEYDYDHDYDLIRPWTDKPKTLQVGWVYDSEQNNFKAEVIAAHKGLYVVKFLDNSRLNFYKPNGEHEGKDGFLGGYQSLNLESGRPAEEV